MKVVFSSLGNISNKIKYSNSLAPQFAKQYPEDSINITKAIRKKNTFWQKFLNLFGINKLNPQTFSDGRHTPRGPYSTPSRESAELSELYLHSNYISDKERITNGFRDGGHKAVLDNFGNVIFSPREIITIDKNMDSYLANAIKFVKTNTMDKSEKTKMKYIFNVMRDISGNAIKSEKRSAQLANLAAGRDVLLGKIFEKEAAVCRHKALLFKLLADECGLKTRIIRGASVDLGGYGGHVWNEVKLSNGKKFLVDVQNSKIIDISNSKALKNIELVSYCDQKLRPIYYID